MDNIISEENETLSDNYITNQLLTKYDQKFNEKYNTILTLNSSIMNKEELILKEDDEINSKNNTITILKYTLYLIFIIGLLLFLKLMGKLSANGLMWGIIGLIVIYLIAIYYSIYSTFNLTNAQRTIQGLEIKMANYVNNITSDLIDYQCPTQCQTISNNPPATNMVQMYKTPTLITDSQTNVWKYGDIPSGGYSPNVTPQDIYQSPTGIPNYNSPLNEPQPSFGTTYPRSTYYQCKWLGGESSGLPNVEQPYSTIPCNYRQNYEEVGRYLCSEDPNVTGSIDTCENISI